MDLASAPLVAVLPEVSSTALESSSAGSIPNGGTLTSRPFGRCAELRAPPSSWPSSPQAWTLLSWGSSGRARSSSELESGKLSRLHGDHHCRRSWHRKRVKWQLRIMSCRRFDSESWRRSLLRNSAALVWQGISAQAMARRCPQELRS